MIDKVIKLKNGTRYYVLDEVMHMSRRFTFCVECDYEKSEYKDNYRILEIAINDGKLMAIDVEDKVVLENITNLFLSKIKNLNEDI